MVLLAGALALEPSAAAAAASSTLRAAARALTGAQGGGLPAQASAPEQQVQLDNDPGPRRLRFDTAGNALDAHDGEIVQFGDRFYLYGTACGCGYHRFSRPASPFCGVRVALWRAGLGPQDVSWPPRRFVLTPGKRLKAGRYAVVLSTRVKGWRGRCYGTVGSVASVGAGRACPQARHEVACDSGGSSASGSRPLSPSTTGEFGVWLGIP
jgi:hypothetical protein